MDVVRKRRAHLRKNLLARATTETIPKTSVVGGRSMPQQNAACSNEIPARGKVDAVAEQGIIEPQIGAHIADYAGAGIQPDADVERNVGVTALPGL
jgi:hypothetical protein